MKQIQAKERWYFMTTNAGLAALIIAIALVPTGTLAGKQASQLAPAQEKAVDHAIAKEMQKQRAIGLAIGILRNRKIVYLKGYGLSDRERLLPATTKTVFNWASNSKPLLAILAMMLFGQGKLDLDADVRTYLPEYPKQRRTIRVRHLLCHQSGIPHYGFNVIGLKKQYKTKLPFLDPIVALDWFSLSALQYQPGEKVLYSSHAYVLASAVVQRAGRQPLAGQIRDKIIRPLGLSSLQMDVPYARQDHWAVGYGRDRNGKITRVKEYAHYWKHGAGAYKSNIESFAKWAEALLQRKLVSKKVESIMWTPQKTNDGEITKFGLGFGVQAENGRLKISHNGKQPETSTRMVLYPEEGHGVVVMCNCSHVDPNRITTALYSALKNDESMSCIQHDGRRRFEISGR